MSLGSNKIQDFATTEESRIDWGLVCAALAIACIGLLNIYSVTAATSETGFIIRQSLFILCGCGLVTILLAFDYRLFERMAYLLYGVNLLCLMAVPLIGVTRYGARRWIDLGIIAYQPSETMKILSVLAVAKYFHSKGNNQKLDFKHLIVPGLILLVPGGLTILQPDLGTGGHLLITGAIILLFIGIRTRVLLTLALLGAICLPVAYKYGLKEYQRNRIQTFIDPTKDPRGTGYNTIQAMIAVGSGEALGKGFRKGTQTQLEFTPEGHTDFIFTVLAEEWGFFGAITLFILYCALFYRCTQVAMKTHDTFAAIVCVGIIAMLSTQVCINIAMVCGLFPIVGIPLPLVSYGGTSVLTVSIALGLVMNIAYRRTIF